MTMPRSITVKGQTFPSLSAAAKAFGASGITGAHISSRLHMGWDPERAVSEPAGNRRKGITGPDGKSYRSCADLARAYGMDPGTVLDRIGKGISPELAVYPGDLHRIPAKDHLGNEYESLSEMARQYGITPSTLFARLKRGDGIRRALRPAAPQRQKKETA